MHRSTLSFTLSGLLVASGAALADVSATAGTELNIRSGPGPQFDVVGVIPANAAVILHGCGEDGAWCRVEHDGVEGWSYGAYLLAEADTDVEPEAPEPVTVVERRTEINVPVVSYENHAPEQAALGLGSGAAAGALVGGPIGAAVGGAAGAVLGAIANVPEPVVSYVREHRTETVILDGEVVLGAELPDTVEAEPVPDSDYRYIYVNGLPVVVDSDGRRIVHIVR